MRRGGVMHPPQLRMPSPGPKARPASGAGTGGINGSVDSGSMPEPQPVPPGPSAAPRRDQRHVDTADGIELSGLFRGL